MKRFNQTCDGTLILGASTSPSTTTRCLSLSVGGHSSDTNRRLLRRKRIQRQGKKNSSSAWRRTAAGSSARKKTAKKSSISASPAYLHLLLASPPPLPHVALLAASASKRMTLLRWRVAKYPPVEARYLSTWLSGARACKRGKQQWRRNRRHIFCYQRCA